MAVNGPLTRDSPRCCRSIASVTARRKSQVAVEVANRLAAFVRLAPAVGRVVHVDRIADRAGAEGETRGRLRIGRALQGLDVAFGLLEVGEVAGAGNRLHVAIRPGRQLVGEFVEVGQLIALFVDLPVVGIAAHHDDVVRPVLDRHPGAHHREVQVIPAGRRSGTARRCSSSTSGAAASGYAPAAGQKPPDRPSRRGTASGRRP